MDWIVQSISLTMPGYIKLRSGLIAQWGKASVSQNSPQTITLPVPFTATATYVSFANHPGTGDAQINVYERTSSTMTIYVHYEIDPSQWVNVDWFAIGH